MRVIHRTGKKEVKRDLGLNIPPDRGFMLSSRDGGFLMQGAQESFSRYCGAFFLVNGKDNWEMYKAIELYKSNADIKQIDVQTIRALNPRSCTPQKVSRRETEVRE